MNQFSNVIYNLKGIFNLTIPIIWNIQTKGIWKNIFNTDHVHKIITKNKSANSTN